MTKALPKIELTESECRRYEARADEIGASEPPEVLFAIAAKLGMVDSLGHSEYRSWAEDLIADAEAQANDAREQALILKALLAEKDVPKSRLVEIAKGNLARCIGDLRCAGFAIYTRPSGAYWLKHKRKSRDLALSFIACPTGASSATPALPKAS